jgi:hypothetical protein
MVRRRRGLHVRSACALERWWYHSGSRPPEHIGGRRESEGREGAKRGLDEGGDLMGQFLRPQALGGRDWTWISSYGCVRAVSPAGVASATLRCGCPLGGSGGRQSRLRICERARSAIRVDPRGLLPCMYIATARPAQIERVLRLRFSFPLDRTFLLHLAPIPPNYISLLPAAQIDSL